LSGTKRGADTKVNEKMGARKTGLKIMAAWNEKRTRPATDSEAVREEI
jgi:hypothetical protein